MPRVFSSGKEAVIKELITTNLFFFLSGTLIPDISKKAEATKG